MHCNSPNINWLIPKAAFLYSNDYSLQSPDQIFGSLVAGYLFAGCFFARYTKQGIRLATSGKTQVVSF